MNHVNIHDEFDCITNKTLENKIGDELGVGEGRSELFYGETS